jgi:hypothetical protein
MSNHHQVAARTSSPRTAKIRRPKSSKVNRQATPPTKFEIFRRWIREIGHCAEESHTALIQIGVLIGVLAFVLFLAGKAIADAVAVNGLL